MSTLYIVIGLVAVFVFGLSIAIAIVTMSEAVMDKGDKPAFQTPMVRGDNGDVVQKASSGLTAREYIMLAVSARYDKSKNNLEKSLDTFINKD